MKLIVIDPKKRITCEACGEAGGRYRRANGVQVLCYSCAMGRSFCISCGDLAVRDGLCVHCIRDLEQLMDEGITESSEEDIL